MGTDRNIKNAHLGLDLLSHGSVAAHVDVAQRVPEKSPHLRVLLADQVLDVSLTKECEKSRFVTGRSLRAGACRRFTIVRDVVVVFNPQFRPQCRLAAQLSSTEYAHSDRRFSIGLCASIMHTARQHRHQSPITTTTSPKPATRECVRTPHEKQEHTLGPCRDMATWSPVITPEVTQSCNCS